MYICEDFSKFFVPFKCVPMARAFDGYIGLYLILLAAPLNF